MKYFKISCFFLLAAMLICVTYTNAEQVFNYSPQEVPAFSHPARVEKVRKTEEGTQYAKKVTANDNWSGDERAIEGRLSLVDSAFAASNSDWMELPKGSKVAFHQDFSLPDRDYTLFLRAKKSTMSGCKFYGTWYLTDY